jgi:hypothetical protein
MTRLPRIRRVVPNGMGSVTLAIPQVTEMLINTEAVRVLILI